MKIRKLLILLTIAFAITASAQDEKTVTLVVSGQGETLDEAKQNALRSAIEQAFGTFISSKTEIFNDQVVADEIASVASGNIQSFSILNEAQLPDGTWALTLEALVSIGKLTSFVEARGVAIEIKGGMFALNIKQQLLNEQGEVNAVREMVGLLHENMQISFDYEIQSSDPVSVDATSENWEIPLVVTATTNKNMDFCANYCIKTLEAISLTTEEIASYKSLNKAVFPVVIKYLPMAKDAKNLKEFTKEVFSENKDLPKNSETKKWIKELYNDVQGKKEYYSNLNTQVTEKAFYLRQQKSINALETLLHSWEFYTRLFTVQSGIDEKNGYSYDGYGAIRLGEERLHTFDQALDPCSFMILGKTGHIPSCLWNLEVLEVLRRLQFKPVPVLGIDFLTTDKLAATFSWQDKRTLAQIEQLTGYNVKPRGVVSPFKHGGFVVHEEDGHGWVAAFCDFPTNKEWSDAKASCNELVLNGYSDWYLPSAEEVYWAWRNLAVFGIGGFSRPDKNLMQYASLTPYWYWSSKETKRGDEDNRVELPFDEVVWNFRKKACTGAWRLAFTSRKGASGYERSVFVSEFSAFCSQYEICCLGDSPKANVRAFRYY